VGKLDAGARPTASTEVVGKDAQKPVAQPAGSAGATAAAPREGMLAGTEGRLIDIDSGKKYAKVVQKEAGSNLVVAEFTASWCGPCHKVAPAYRALARTHPATLFLAVDAEKCVDQVLKFKIEAFPTFILLREGKELMRVHGPNMTKLEKSVVTEQTSGDARV